MESLIMRAKKLMIAVAILGCCALSGCAKKSGAGQYDGSGSAMSSAGGDASGQTYGTGSGGDMSGSNNVNGMVQNRMVAPSNQTYYFDFDQNTVLNSDMPYIKQQADYIATHPNAKVRLEGNTDDRGSREYNIGLGWRRDQAVARVMQLEGVKPSQIAMVSFGKEKPAVDGDNEQAWRLNRRVNLVYEAK
jgi:peptidoglycan-associated lipoprotein